MNMRNSSACATEVEQVIQRFRKLIYQCRVCTLCAATGEGEMITKPLYTAGVDESGDLYFYFREEEPDSLDNINWNNNIHLLYTNTAKRIHLEVTGKSLLIMDKQKVRDYWNPLLSAYFPAGNYTMRFMKVHVTRATCCNDFHGTRELLIQHPMSIPQSLQVEVVTRPALQQAVLQKVG